MHKTLVATLNWNGWIDTVACIQSLLASIDDSTEVLIVDNGSDNDSLSQIHSFLGAQGEATGHWQNEGDSGMSFRTSKSLVHVLQLPQNIGFARGCNRAARFAEELGFEFLILLNNDAVVTPNALASMHLELTKQHADVVIPRIEYFAESGVIWNCGGEVTYWGHVQYYFARRKSTDVRFPSALRVGFATGCCMLMRVRFFVDVGGFTEKFFFGEEDVEFALRMKKLNRKMVCATNALVLHKVGASLAANPDRDLRKAYVHILNRLVNMKSFMPRMLWFPWAAAVCARFRLGSTYRFNRTLKHAGRLFLEACSASEVDGVRFRQILRDGI